MFTWVIAFALAIGVLAFVRATHGIVRLATGVTDPAGLVLSRHSTPASLPTDERQTAVVADLTAAEGLLDELEVCGCADTELAALGSSMFAVRWRETA